MSAPDEATRALIEEAAERGAQRALERIGLHDEHAGRDVSQLRDLIEAWRDFKTTARRTFVSWTIKLLLGALLIGVAVKLKIFGP